MKLTIGLVTCWYKNISMANYSRNLKSRLEKYPFIKIQIISTHCDCLPKYAGLKDVLEDQSCQFIDLPPFTILSPRNRIGRILSLVARSFHQLLLGTMFLSKCKSCNVIHYQQTSSPSFGTVPLIPIILIPTPMKKIVTIHNLETIVFLRRSLTDKLRRILYNRSDRIIVHSENTKKNLVSTGVKPHKIRVIPHGVNIPVISPRIRSRMAFFGAPTQVKGAWTILKALKILKERKAHCKVYFYGICSAAERRLFDEKVRELHVEDCIEWGGRLTEKQFDQRMQESMFILAPYKYSVSGSSVLTRAMANATPTIATHVGGNTANVQDFTLIVPKDDPEALAEAILELKNDFEKRNKMGKIAREQASKISWDKIVGRILNVYVDTLKSHNTC